MDYNIEEHNDNKLALAPLKKNMDKQWEEELREWVVEEFYIPYQASWYALYDLIQWFPSEVYSWN